MSKYLVIGLNDGDRFAQDFEADSPEHAERQAMALYPDMTIAGVINEEGQVVA
jgi:hypothetical protein